MFTIVTRNTHFGIMYNNCQEPCATPHKARLIPCVCSMAYNRVAVCHRVTISDQIELAEFLMEYMGSKP